MKTLPDLFVLASHFIHSHVLTRTTLLNCYVIIIVNKFCNMRVGLMSTALPNEVVEHFASEDLLAVLKESDAAPGDEQIVARPNPSTS